ncbi:Response regulator receiver domain-containing protein [Nannocystis exedens]|uniref:Response regulator receiver domain-containing protein n=2 Tax=Nannocystis exedens TaxID=54 RepID=A0A1I2GCD5_9BACT|nr:response regulator [Nannocystis exedens]SFF14660.1 Response regulator receiver domain-containing protein [Nannocystis exedens]
MHSALIIDADGKTPATLKNILAPYGFEFTITENGPEAVNVARQAAPDIIFLRAELPLTSGFSVCNRLRRHEDTKRIPLIMYSSNVSEDVFEQHRNLKTHADDYLRLPLDEGRLVAAIRPVLPIGEAKAAPGGEAAPSAGGGGPPAAKPARSGRSKERLEIELRDAPARAGDNRQAFEQEFADGFNALQDEPSSAIPREGSGAVPPPDGEMSDASMAVGGFKAQREVLQLKSQLNARSREILTLKDELESRERTIVDAKKLQRELQAQISELENQVLAAQEQILSSRENIEAAVRDKQTALKREEGVKTRLEVLQKKLKETETEFAAFRAQTAQDRDKSAIALAEVQQRLEIQAGVITELESERDRLTAQLIESNGQVSSLVDGFEGARKSVAGLESQLEHHRQEMERALADAETERVAALESLARQHQAELDEREQDHRAAVAQLQSQLNSLRDQAQQERERMSQALIEAEENARLQVSQLTQTLAATEEAARREIQQLQQTLAQAEETARGEIASLQAALAETRSQADDAAADNARRIAGLEHQVDELGAQLDRAESLLARRRDAAQRAQQALAVGLKLLEDDDPT